LTGKYGSGDERKCFWSLIPQTSGRKINPVENPGDPGMEEGHPV